MQLAGNHFLVSKVRRVSAQRETSPFPLEQQKNAKQFGNNYCFGFFTAPGGWEVSAEMKLFETPEWKRMKIAFLLCYQGKQAFSFFSFLKKAV